MSINKPRVAGPAHVFVAAPKSKDQLKLLRKGIRTRSFGDNAPKDISDNTPEGIADKCTQDGHRLV
jgi:hypothetical protein